MNDNLIQSLTPRLPTQDLRRAIQFYSELLGFTPCVLWPEEKPAFCILQRNGVQIAFHQDDEFAHTGKPNGVEL